MKKLTSILLVLALLAGVLAGCGSKASSGEAAPAEESAPFSLGTLENGVYTNTYVGIGCSLDESWMYYGAEELQDVSEMVEGTLGEDLMAKYQTITDMMAQSVSGTESINVAYTYIPLTERLTYKLLSDSDIIEQTLETSEEFFISTYESMGMENIAFESVTVTFLGEDRVGLKTSGTLLGSNYYMLQVFDYSLGAYGVTITTSSLGEDITQDLLNVFYTVD